MTDWEFVVRTTVIPCTVGIALAVAFLWWLS